MQLNKRNIHFNNVMMSNWTLKKYINSKMDRKNQVLMKKGHTKYLSTSLANSCNQTLESLNNYSDLINIINLKHVTIINLTNLNSIYHKKDILKRYIWKIFYLRKYSKFKKWIEMMRLYIIQLKVLFDPLK